MLVFLGTPNLAARVERLRQKLSNSRVSSDDQEKCIRVLTEFLDSRWDSVRFLTFAENEILLNAAVDLSLSGTLSREALVSKLQGIARTATIQGAVKEDYLLSETMSRL